MSEHPELPDLIRKTGVPVPQVLDRSGETLAWKPAEDMAPKLDDLIEALGARATEQTLAEIKTLLGDGNQRVQLTGSLPEVASAQYTEVASTVQTYTRAAGASRMDVFVESGYVRVRTDGQPCTATTGEPIGAGFCAGWPVASISVYYSGDSVITVVSR